MSLTVYAKNTLTLSDVINNYLFKSSTVISERLKLENELLEYDNYKKGFLPCFQLDLSPLSFNRSMRLLQDPYSGNYSNVEDYSNTSSASLSMSQKIGPTNGTLTASSSLSLLREFSRDNNSFSSTPFYISYSQSLWGGNKQYKFTRDIMHLQHDIMIKNFCTSVSSEQQTILSLYLTAYSELLKRQQANNNMEMGDTLLKFAKLKRANGYITDYEYNQVELQQLENSYEQEHASQNYREAILKLKNKLDINSDMEIEKPDVNELPDILDVDRVTECIYRNNPHVLNDELQRKQAVYNKYTSRMSTFMNGTVSVNYGLNKYASSIKGAYERPDSRQGVSISFSIPAFEWGINHNKRKIADNEYKAALLDLEIVRKSFDEQVLTQAMDYNYTHNMLKIAERSYLLSQEQYKLAVQKFKYGKISVYELISIEKAQQTAMQQYYSALQSLFSGYYALRHLALYDFKTDRELADVFKEMK
jgi:outer membrane protein TolC